MFLALRLEPPLVARSRFSSSMGLFDDMLPTEKLFRGSAEAFSATASNLPCESKKANCQ
jgi:hypothetical protein